MTEHFRFFILKVGPVDTNSLHSRAKVTIPREPDLETAQRAQRRRYINFLSDYSLLLYDF